MVPSGVAGSHPVDLEGPVQDLYERRNEWLAESDMWESEAHAKFRFRTGRERKFREFRSG